jgi:hypothetical protein
MFSLFILTIIVVGCGIYTNVIATADETIDFNVYKTFAWLPDETDSTNLPYNNEIIRNNIKNYFGQSFAARGYVVNLSEPDILLGITVNNIKKEKEEITIYTPYPFPYPYYYQRYYYGSDYYSPYHFDYYYHGMFSYPLNYTTRNYEIIESSITLNVFDREQNKLVWQGTAKGNIYDEAYVNKNIHPAVEAIMKKYPVKKITNSIYPIHDGPLDAQN